MSLRFSPRLGRLAAGAGCAFVLGAGHAAPAPSTERLDLGASTLRFERGYPAAETVTRLYDELDYQRAVQAYIWSLPLVSFAQWMDQHEKVFGARDGDVVYYDSFRDKLGLLTANDVTPYIIGFVNLQRTGPLVIDYPAGPTLGGILDFWQRPITDLGIVGPEKGAGAKILLLGPGQEAPADVAGYTVLRSPTNNVFHAFRVLTTDAAQAEKLKGAYRAYAYSRREQPTATRMLSPAGKPWSGSQPRGLAYWQMLSRAINEEPVHERDRMMLAMLKPLGIEKGKPFKPDARQVQLLERAATAGEATVRAMTYAKRQPEAVFYPGTQWRQAVLLQPSQETPDYTALDERAAWFYEAVALTAGMTIKRAGLGQTYLGVQKDKQGQWLDGGKTYRLRVPADVPTQQLWAMTLYDNETRCFIDNPHDIAGRNSRDDMIKNPDGSVDLYFGPRPVKGLEKNWVPTVAGRGWFAYFRLFSPTQAYFDKTWSLPDIEPVAL